MTKDSGMGVGHTPGPWKAINGKHSYADGTGTSEWRVEGGENEFVLAAIIGDVADVRKHAKANARLIAAAPDLLALLEEAVDALADGIETESEYEPEHSRFARKFVVKARALITKAKTP